MGGLAEHIINDGSSLSLSLAVSLCLWVMIFLDSDSVMWHMA